jgi:cytochrome c556
MLRTMFAIVTIAVGVSAVVAQQDVINERKELMKENGNQAKIGAAMAKGEAPFDAAKVEVMFATFADAAAKMPALFPDNSKTGGETAALPAIWENKADFDAKMAQFGKNATAAKTEIKDADSFKAKWGAFTKDNCGGCHEKYRAKKS